MSFSAKRIAVGAAILLALPALSAPADATILTYTFTGFNLGGNYDDDYDHLGLFGTPANLDNRAFRLVFTLDTTLGIATTWNDPSSSATGHTYIRPNFSDPNDPHDAAHTPPITATLTIDGHSYQFDGTFSQVNSYISTPSSAVGTKNAFGYFTDLTFDVRNGPDADSKISILARSVNHVIPLGYDQGYTIDFTKGAGRDPDFYTNGYFDIRPDSTDYFGFSHSGLRADRLVVAVGNGVVAGVPEPSSWALLLMGFSLVGVSLRKRHAGLVT